MGTHIRFDWAIKNLLRNKANFDILEGFLSELLMEDVYIEEIIESESNKSHLRDKGNKIDILVRNSKKQFVLIEIQNEREHDYFHRMSYGQAKLISENLFEGDLYKNVKKVYSINIVYFDLGQGKDYIYISEGNFIGMHTKDVLQLSKKQQDLYAVHHTKDIFTTYYVLRLNAFDDIAKDTLDEWIYFLKNSKIPANAKAKGLSAAKEKMRVMDMTKSEKMDYDDYIKFQRVKMGEHETAVFDATYALNKKLMASQKREEKEKKAKEKAQKREEKANKEKEKAQKRLLETAKLLKDLGVPVTQIMQKTGLSKEEIQNL